MVVTRRYQFAKRKLALIIPAHNEELVLADTIASAIRAGQALCDIYVVNDSSSDQTQHIAETVLGPNNVLSVQRSGKAKAILQALEHFKINTRYYWVHVADADGVFASTYFAQLRSRLNLHDVAATGHIQSLKGGWVSKYRLYEYTLGLEILRRVQAFFGVIPVMPGPTSVYRTDILGKLDFTAGTLTEDMDITFQIHRQKLGRIAYIPQARTSTQDPKDLHDYYNQIQRWYRGNLQVIVRHRIGQRRQRLDFYICFVMLEQIILLGALSLVPFIAWWSQDYGMFGRLFISDVSIFLALTIWAAALNRRPDVLGAFPLFYVLRAVNLYVFIKAGYEIVIRRRFQTAPVGWATTGRRYRLAAEGLIK